MTRVAAAASSASSAAAVSAPVSAPVSRFKFLIVTVLSGGTCLACLFLLSLWDFRAVLFMRSLDVPLVDRLGGLGDVLGDGVTLALLCAGLWGFGWWWRRPACERAGRDALAAFVTAGLAAQLFKHLIGRPRPRFAHQEALPFDYGPSLQVGLDAFPSGHATGSFAVAAVLARAFPTGAWAWYGGALLVGASRVVRGSHFPTDVLGGAVLGFLIGYVWARPLAEWRRHLTRAWACALPFVVGGCALFWNVFSRPVDSPVSRGMFWAGLACCAGGMGVRWRMTRRGAGPAGSAGPGSESGPASRQLVLMYATGAILLGLAVSLQTWWVAAAAFMACVVWWMTYHDDHEAYPAAATTTTAAASTSTMRTRELWLTGLWVIAAAVVHGLRGLAPLR